MATYNWTEANKAQEKYCEEHKLPHFAPSRYCYRCHKDIYEKISVESAGNHLITGCPHCSWSFCD